ncbi:hypothetical protein [Thioclava nitratireducens]|uniref:hypothetical protein n=1 Tax=Thioclava nitratireducens TaxID=1915078 RepID=UPI00248075AB|nr:hypothetical protein [Thioclava nitratireducens]WGT51452.1 hypothetical protein P0N61_05330 [Thioclava nitratireducens]
MAIIANIMRHIRNEGTNDDPAASILTLFPQFLEAFADFLDYESYLSAVQSWDPAFASWQKASDEAQERMLELQNEILAETPSLPAEKPIKLIVYALRIALLDEDGAQRAQFRKLIRNRGHELLVIETCDADRRINALLKRTLILFDQLLDVFSFDAFEQAEA